MAKDIESKKDVSEATPDEAKSEKASKARDGGSKRSKKKKGIRKYFKDAIAEFKKVVWPTPKQTTNNTIVVLAMCVIAAIFIFGVDALFGLFNRLVLGQG